jgi:hypothetical protein
MSSTLQVGFGGGKKYTKDDNEAPICFPGPVVRGWDEMIRGEQNI